MKDSTIIPLLIFTWMMVAIGVLGVESEMDRMERQINELYSSQNDVSEALEELRQENIHQDERMAQIERYDHIQDMRLDAHREELTNLNSLFTNILEDMDALEEKFDAMPSNALGLELSETDIRNISALVYLEAGSGSYKLQKAIASVIFNRMIRYNLTASEAIYQRGVFSPASRVARTTPSESCVRAVRDVMTNGLSLPADVLAFQLYGFHNFGHPYCKIDNVYFTTL